MRRRAWTYGPIPLALAMLTGGCTVDHYARAMLHQNTLNGRVRLWLLGSGEQMLRQGRIDAHRRIASFDGTPIDTWVIADRRPDRATRAGKSAPPTKGTAVLLHGLLDSKARFFGLGQRLANRGYHVVLPDHRVHGRSGGTCVTYGAKEKRDIRAVVDALLADGTVAEPIYVFGFSMGAAVAVEYAAIDDRVRGVMSCAPYAELRTMTRRVGWWLGEQTRSAVLARAGELGGFDPAEVSAASAAGRLAVPLLVVHGTWDPIVPYEEGKRVFDAAGEPKRMITLPRMGHVSLLLGREEWFADRFEEMVRRSRGESGPAVKDR